MTQQFPPPPNAEPSGPASPPAPAPARVRWLPTLLTAGAALILGFGLGTALDLDESSPAAVSGSTSTSSARPTTTAPPTTTTVKVKPTDFELAVTILEKKCFGSAGCNITYRITPTWVGTGSIPRSGEFTVVYQVLGGDSGPQINQFEVIGDQVSYDGEENISTARESDVLTASVTQIIQ